jgi:hypothetical protein
MLSEGAIPVACLVMQQWPRTGDRGDISWSNCQVFLSTYAHHGPHDCLWAALLLSPLKQWGVVARLDACIKVLREAWTGPGVLYLPAVWPFLPCRCPIWLTADPPEMEAEEAYRDGPIPLCFPTSICLLRRGVSLAAPPFAFALDSVCGVSARYCFICAYDSLKSF